MGNWMYFCWIINIWTYFCLSWGFFN